jgi:hypothetical protein
VAIAWPTLLGVAATCAKICASMCASVASLSAS